MKWTRPIFCAQKKDKEKLKIESHTNVVLLQKQLVKAIGHRFSNENILCAASWRAFKTYAAEKGMDIYQFKSDGKIRTEGLYHIQNVNNYHRRLKRVDTTI